ncbi:hypothetical protein GCM10027430_14290 [Lysobacter tyrosinilyticus]
MSAQSLSRLSVSIAAILFAGVCQPAFAAIVVDGRVDEPDWAQATLYDDFKITEPYRMTPPDPGTGTQARMLSTPEGIVVSFVLQQAHDIQRVKPRLERDQEDPADSVNFIIDFDGDSNAGYSFTVGLSGSILDGVVSNENVVNYDWDTDWSWAVSETEEGWQVEMLIPWTVAPMRGTDTPTRAVNVYFSRQLGGSGERMAFPAVSTERGRYLSGFEKVEIPQYRKALFHYWPYLTANHDMIDGHTKFKTGMDVFWKPSPNFQLSATVNPDFGQVEADDLVINFDAIETFFSDRRPFFTENQSLFDVGTADNSRLINTRRIGAESDDGSGVADIKAALKLNGSLDRLTYGLLAASEGGDSGRDFYATRLLYPVSDRLNIGWLGTYVDRPFLDRTALVQQVDMLWRPNDAVVVNGQVLGSSIDRAGTSTDDTGAWVRVNWTPSNVWNYRFETTHFGRFLNFNDFGYQRRTSLNEFKSSAAYTHRVKNEDSILRSTRWLLQLQARSNDRGDRLPTAIAFVNNYNFRNGNRFNANATFFTRGWEDLISRGNGLWWKSQRTRSEFEFISRRYGNWTYSAGLTAAALGLSAKPGQELELSANWYPSDDFNMSFQLGPDHTTDWLIWEGGTNFGRYQRRGDFIQTNISWFPSLKHELRLKSEWVSMRATDGRAYQLDASGRMLATGMPRPDFDVNSFGLQLRYRYLLGPQSDIFLAYSRGGELRQNRDRIDTIDMLDEALDLRDSDQLLAKIRYRF